MEIVMKLQGNALQQYAIAAASLTATGRVQLQRGLNAGGEKVRTQVRRALKEQTSVKKAGTVANFTPSIVASTVKLEYVIKAKGKGLPIEEFPWRRSRSKKALVRWSPREHWRLQERDEDGRFSYMDDTTEAAIYARLWGSVHPFKRSFMTDKGPRALRPGAKRSMRALFGPSLPKELPRDRSLAAFQFGVPHYVEPILAKRLKSYFPS